jgi:hypothetical protein
MWHILRGMHAHVLGTDMQKPGTRIKYLEIVPGKSWYTNTTVPRYKYKYKYKCFCDTGQWYRRVHAQNATYAPRRATKVNTQLSCHTDQSRKPRVRKSLKASYHGTAHKNKSQAMFTIAHTQPHGGGRTTGSATLGGQRRRRGASRADFPLGS